MRIFVDMDGTLARWSYVSQDVLHSDGYFASLQPQNNVQEAVEVLAKDNEVFILSAYIQDSDYALRDKNIWLDKFMPFMSAENRLFVPYGSDKYDYVPGGVRPDDVLLDDYTPNLIGWAKHSGTGVKLLNGINHTHKTWNGAMANADDAPCEIAKIIAEAGACAKNN